MDKEIQGILRKYYVKDVKWKLDPENIEQSFRKAWGREHGGYFSRLDASEFNPPKYLPYKTKTGYIYIPEIATGDRAFQKKYVKECNRLLLENDSEHLKLDFRDNHGGKPEVMLAGLLPLFNMSRRKILMYITNSSIHKDVVKSDGLITCVSNNNASMKGSRRKLMRVKKITVLVNIHTASAAEQCVIAMRALPNVNVVGRSGGYTTCNRYFALSNGDSIEVPVGYMTDVYGHVYR